MLAPCGQILPAPVLSNGRFSVFLQGARVWLREQDQLQPCTVGPCADGNVRFTSDYGTVSGNLHKAVRYACAGIAPSGHSWWLSLFSALCESCPVCFLCLPSLLLGDWLGYLAPSESSNENIFILVWIGWANCSLNVVPSLSGPASLQPWGRMSSITLQGFCHLLLFPYKHLDHQIHQKCDFLEGKEEPTLMKHKRLENTFETDQPNALWINITEIWRGIFVRVLLALNGQMWGWGGNLPLLLSLAWLAVPTLGCLLARFCFIPDHCGDLERVLVILFWLWAQSETKSIHHWRESGNLWLCCEVLV